MQGRKKDTEGKADRKGAAKRQEAYGVYKPEVQMGETEEWRNSRAWPKAIGQKRKN